MGSLLITSSTVLGSENSMIAQFCSLLNCMFLTGPPPLFFLDSKRSSRISSFAFGGIFPTRIVFVVLLSVTFSSSSWFPSCKWSLFSTTLNYKTPVVFIHVITKAWLGLKFERHTLLVLNPTDLGVTNIQGNTNETISRRHLWICGLFTRLETSADLNTYSDLLALSRSLRCCLIYLLSTKYSNVIEMILMWRFPGSNSCTQISMMICFRTWFSEWKLKTETIELFF